MAERQQRFSAVRAAYYVISAAAMIAFTVSRVHRWRDRLWFVLFYLGAGGMAYLFFRWRRGGDLLARKWFVAAFGCWVAAVVVASDSWRYGSPVAVLSLAVGTTGAAVVLVRQRRAARLSGPQE